MKPLACVVLSLRCQPGLVSAVQSLRAQGDGPELTVVNSGGGDAHAVLAAAGIDDVHVVDRPERLFPGGARNEGIRATSAPFVAFLAADCTAEPGWIAGRLARHAAGARVVAGAMTNAYPRSAVAQASYALLFHTRRPESGLMVRRLFSASYDRALFEEYGLFRDDLRVGEDSDLHRRFEGEVAIQWAPEVRAAHSHERRVLPALQEHFGRGRRARRALSEIEGGDWRRTIARGQAHNIRAGAGALWHDACTAHERATAVRAAALMPLLAAAYVTGAFMPA